MASQRTHDVTATIGEYKNGQGETKKRYINVGSAFTDEQGRVSIKLDAVPVNPEWSGWLSLYPVKERDGGRPESRQTSQRPEPRNHSVPSNRPSRAPETPLADDYDDSDIPF